MAKRHFKYSGDWESIVGRLEELVLANSGEDEFEEIFKLFVAKLYSEIEAKHRGKFKVHSTPQKTIEVINELLESASRQWGGIIPNEPKSKLRDEHLAICVGEIQSLKLLNINLEILDALFEHLISKSAKGSKGQYFTPRNVIDCCIKIVNPKLNEFILDPACGSGGFLLHSLYHLIQSHPKLDIKSYCQKYIWGFDFDHRAIQVAKALMLIAGDGNANLYRLNSLLTPEANKLLFSTSKPDINSPRLTIEDILRTNHGKFKGFDAIVTNPPFAGEIKEDNILNSYELNRSGRRIERDVLFIERCCKLLKTGGRLAMVVPHNKLGSESWEYVREWLLTHMQVVAVLGLERNTFLPHTHQKTGIVFATKKEKISTPSKNDKILFLVSDKSGKDSKGKIISKTGTSSTDPMWDRADHDYSDLVASFKKYIKSNNIQWSE